MIGDKDLKPGSPLLYRGERVIYVGRSQHGGFVVERDSRFLKGNNRFENAWPFELSPLDSHET